MKIIKFLHDVEKAIFLCSFFVVHPFFFVYSKKNMKLKENFPLYKENLIYLDVFYFSSPPSFSSTDFRKYKYKYVFFFSYFLSIKRLHIQDIVAKFSTFSFFWNMRYSNTDTGKWNISKIQAVISC